MKLPSVHPRPLVALLALAVLAVGSCQRVPPTRTLPTWIRGIYIPMFRNGSYEPGIEEQATMLTQEAFLADGRVDIVPRSDADATLLAEIVDWNVRDDRDTLDRITTTQRVTVRATLKLVEPYNPSSVLADLGTVQIAGFESIDPRSVRYTPEPDRVENILHQLADRILLATISGFPAIQLPNSPAQTPLPLSPGDIDEQKLLRLQNETQ